jgi:two-component system response regulator
MDSTLPPILLVDDSASDNALTKRAFKQANILNPLSSIEDGEEALDYLMAKGKYASRNKFKLPALVLLDLKMPGVNGHEVLRRIRSESHLSGLVVVMLTSSKEEKDITTSYNMGVNSYLTKPVDFNKFAELIKQISKYWLNINISPVRII